MIPDAGIFIGMQQKEWIDRSYGIIAYQASSNIKKTTDSRLGETCSSRLPVLFYGRFKYEEA